MAKRVNHEIVNITETLNYGQFGTNRTITRIAFIFLMGFSGWAAFLSYQNKLGHSLIAAMETAYSMKHAEDLRVQATIDGLHQRGITPPTVGEILRTAATNPY